MKLGQVVVTRGVMDEINRNLEFAKFVVDSLALYNNHDWGDLCDSDKAMNDSALANDDDRIVAKYGDIYIITEWDRSVTTILFTHEY